VGALCLPPYEWRRQVTTSITTRSAAPSTTADGLSEGRYWGDEPNRGHLYKGPHDPSPPVEVRKAAWIPPTVGSLPTTNNGLFACSHITAGTPITTYGGMGVQCPRDISHLHPSTTSHYKTLMHIPQAGPYVIDGFREPRLGFGLAQFCNAGKSPQQINAKFEGSQAEAADTSTHKNSKLGIYIIATRQIEPGEEILLSYATHYWQRILDAPETPNTSPPPTQTPSPPPEALTPHPLAHPPHYKAPPPPRAQNPKGNRATPLGPKTPSESSQAPQHTDTQTHTPQTTTHIQRQRAKHPPTHPIAQRALRVERTQSRPWNGIPKAANSPGRLPTPWYPHPHPWRPIPPPPSQRQRHPLVPTRTPLTFCH
jgi:hypothetical protein